jgi:hypothetical protein
MKFHERIMDELQAEFLVIQVRNWALIATILTP